MTDRKALSDILVSRYEDIFETISNKDITKQELGFEVNHCKTMIASILIHCFENIDIFTDSQIDSLLLIGSKLSNE